MRHLASHQAGVLSQPEKAVREQARCVCSERTMRAARIDSNQVEIVAALRALGCTVQSLAGVGQGCPDLLVGRNGRNYLLEIKDGSKPPSARALTTQEIIWLTGWKGQAFVINNVEEAIAAVGAVLQ